MILKREDKSRKRLASEILLISGFLVFSDFFLDTTTYTKIVVLLFVSVFTLFLNQSDLKFKEIFFLVFLGWSSLLLIYLSVYGWDNLNSILLGYPGRGLGMLAFLIGICIAWYFVAFGLEYFQHFLQVLGVTLSFCVVVASIAPVESFFVSQFVYPYPGSLNSNVISPVLAFSSATFFSALCREVLIKLLSLRALLLSTGTLIVLWASALLNNLQSVLYIIVISATYVLTKLPKSRFTFLIGVAPIIVLTTYVSVVHASFSNLDRFDSSIKERLSIVRIFFNKVSETPFAFRMPDSSADLNLNDYYIPEFPQILDNAHNVWLEIGIHFGWIPLVFLKTSLIVFFVSIVYKIRRSPKISSEDIDLLVLQILGFVMMYVSILHPISLWILVSILAFSAFSYFDKTYSENRKREASHFGINSNIRKIQASFISLVLTLACAYTAVDAIKKIQFRQIEIRLDKGLLEPELAIKELTDAALELNDRAYLDYTARQLLTVSQENPSLGCPSTREVLAEMEKIGFVDLNYRNASQLLRERC